MDPLLATGLPRYRAIVALDIERSTSRPDPVKAELRNKTYELFDAALCSAGIRKRLARLCLMIIKGRRLQWP